MKLYRTICLLLILLLATPRLHAAKGSLLLLLPCTAYIASLATMIVGGAMWADAAYVAQSCLAESTMIPCDAPDYNQRKEAVLQKYKAQGETIDFARSVSKAGFVGFISSTLLCAACRICCDC